MILKSVHIKNFRSIKELSIDFSDSTFKILVGKNESGKTNILKAISFLSPDFNPTEHDIREPLPDENSVEEAYIRFLFILNSIESQTVFKNISSKIFLKNKETKIITDGIVKYSLLEFCKVINEGLYRINVLDRTRTTQFWFLNSKYKFLDNIKRSKNYKKSTEEGKTIETSIFVDINEIGKINDEDFIDADIKELNAIIGTENAALIISNLPKVMYWQYDEKNLLPASINIDSFAADPNTCLPLKNLFKIAGITNIAKEITTAKNGTKNKLRNLLERVAEHATNHFRAVWTEYDYISFSLLPNGVDIDAGIKEKNTFSLDQRSDGFKRFVTFLLMLSVNAKNNDLANTVIVIDEPDMGLHPSGIRSLRDELIYISKNNYVIASTHSIFLIDKKNITRHYIVKKHDEITNLEIPQEDNLVEEEVLFKALGYSIFDQLKEKNILFEGWRDKKLFKTALSKLQKENKQLFDELNNIGVSNSTGVKNIKNITPVFELSNKKCLIISDNDTAALEKQREFKKERIFGTWKRYNEVASNRSIITGEDYITPECIEKGLNKIKQTNPNFNNDYNLLNPNKGIISEIQRWLRDNGVIDKQEISNHIDVLKNSIFNSLKASEIKNAYFEFIECLNEVLNKL